MNVRQNRAPTKGKTETPDTRIMVGTVRVRLYGLARDRAEQGDKRAARLREWFESPETGRSFGTRWQEIDGQIDKVVRAAGMRLAQGYAQSHGAFGVAHEEGFFLGIRPSQVEILRQPLPATLRRLPSTETGVDGMRLFAFSKAVEAFVNLLAQEFSHIDKAVQAHDRARAARDKGNEERTKLRAKWDALSAAVPDERDQGWERAYTRANAAYDAWATASRREYELENRVSSTYYALRDSVRPAAWAEILTLARWLLAWTYAATLYSRLFSDMEVVTGDSEERGIGGALMDALFGQGGVLGSDAGVSFLFTPEGMPQDYLRGSQTHYVHPPTWATSSSAPLIVGDDGTVAFSLSHASWIRSSFDPNRKILTNGGWKEGVEKVRTLLMRLDDVGPFGTVKVYGAGRAKNVPVLIGRPLEPERGEIAGFRVSVYGMGLFVARGKHVERFYERVSETIPLSMRIVREQAQRYFPALLREYKPSHTIFNLVPTFGPPGGHYHRHGDTVVIFPTQHRRAKGMAKTWVHEAGHHVWTDYLSPAKKQVWIDAVEADAPYDLTILRDAMREAKAKRGEHAVIRVDDRDVSVWLKENNGYLYILTQRLSSKYRYERLREGTASGWGEGESVAGLSKDMTLEEVEAMIAAKEAAGEAPMIYFKGLPTTVYGATNAEEGWCEAFSYYITYGPDAVLPQLRAAMRRLLPDMRRNPDDEDDEAPPEGRG